MCGPPSSPGSPSRSGRAVAIVVVVAVAPGFSCPGRARPLLPRGRRLFFLLGYVPYRLRHTPGGDDQARLHGARHRAHGRGDHRAAAAGLGVDWPIQTRLRTPEFLYLLLLLGEAALTYWPVAVLWTGTWIAAIWSLGVWLVYSRADTVRFSDVARDGRLSAEASLKVFLDPAYVGLTPSGRRSSSPACSRCCSPSRVWRSRGTMLAQVRAEVVRADLARYVSPDVADALAAGPMRASARRRPGWWPCCSPTSSASPA